MVRSRGIPVWRSVVRLLGGGADRDPAGKSEMMSEMVSIARQLGEITFAIE